MKAQELYAIISEVTAEFIEYVNVSLTAIAQEFVSPTQPVETGKALGAKVKLLSTNGETTTYVLVFRRVMK